MKNDLPEVGTARCNPHGWRLMVLATATGSGNLKFKSSNQTRKELELTVSVTRVL